MSITEMRLPLVAEAARLLSFAAAPVFAGMAALAAMEGEHMASMMCMGGGAMLTGMVPMYLLMSVFHLPPWLGLLSRCGCAGPCGDGG